MNFRIILATLFLLPVLVFSRADAQDVQTGENVPEWAKHAVWYQIFPERFRNGDPTNDPVSERINAPDGWEITPWTSDWYQRADWEQRQGPMFRDGVFLRRYGGDLQGVIDKLDYLADLGITAIYFNPIFDAVSLHKYDASHYHHIDRHFGPDPEGDIEIMKQEDPADPSTWQWTSADLLFLELLDEARERDIRIIIDGVWNHTGRDFWAFRHIIEHGEDSPYSDWYKITEFSDEYSDGFAYEGWWGYPGLPEFREDGDNIHPEVKEHIFAVTERWMAPNGDVERGVSGWRLDVADELGFEFWREWHAFVRELNPEAITIAEIWDDKARDFIKDDLFSVVMNYRWAYAVHDFFINQNISATEFGERLNALLDDFPDRVNMAMQNLMDSHDTERLSSMIVNADRDYKEGSRITEAENTYDVRAPRPDEWDILRLIATFQFTAPGAPMVYYGTEAGMWGADDPDDRKPMIWPDMNYDDEVNHPFGRPRPHDPVMFDHQLHSWYTQLADTRHRHEAFRIGEFEVLHTDDENQVFAFTRYIENGEFTMVIINRGERDQTLEISPELRKNVALPRYMMDVFTGMGISKDEETYQINVPFDRPLIFVPVYVE